MSSSENSPLRVAVVGSGPAGIYALQHLLEERDLDVEIDLYERLPVPWGLVRYGVAPDHPEKKSIAERLFSYFLGHSNVRFFGGVEIGKDIQHQELAEWYDGVIYAVGANSDTSMGIPGEQLPGSWAAREFVAWYNGHPDCSNLDFDLSCKTAVIVGNGNVALDVARILTMPIEDLKKTDTADYAIEALSNSKIEEVVILGRRGHWQGAYNNPELEELAHLDGVNVSVESDGFSAAGNDADSAFAESSWEARRKVKMLEQLVQNSPKNVRKHIIFKFLASPIELQGGDKVEQMVIGHNKLEADSQGKLKANATGEKSDLDAGLVLRAIGYRGKPFPGLPYDERRGVIENNAGRVTDSGTLVSGTYVTGWIKRGPQGIIGSNKQCAQETVNAFLCDVREGRLEHSTTLGYQAVEEELQSRKLKTVSEVGWRKIDHYEQTQGQALERPRLKLHDVSKMLSIASG